MNLRLPFVVAFLCGGMLLGTGSLSASPTGVSFFSTGLDQAGFSFSDLDVRDANNQPVVSPEAKNEMQDLFISGLFDLLVYSETYAIAQALGIIEKALNLGGQSLVRDIPATVGRVASALFVSLKKFRAVLSSFPALPSFSLPAMMLFLSTLCFLPALERAPLLFIRC